mgnify:CR=1 FL=1
MPRAIFSSSLQPVHTCCPLYPAQMAVPVSWHMGSMPLALTSALRSMVRATKRSLSLASGSERILATISLCSRRSKKELSCVAASARTVSASGSTTSISWPFQFSTRTYLSVSSRYFVLSGPRGKGSW